ncbi:hypothetical protein GCM10029976_013880 [Kribbella albertanoniae]|uniref:Uncharacterized protein n=1 Tax=Kribbella albertanoniae TaxID=1266829 RepID=A0A4R4QD13_9ACTN|nr:hypothetical protein [Kribbella albertanoniae]TDC33059.1 hypothetical protein E1261_07020 [Kribbella albertanoniae]
MNLPAFADLLASRGLRLLPGSHAVPVELLVQLPDATIARFTARGTTLQLQHYPAEALTTITIAAECGCGDHHPQTGPARVTLSRYAVATDERVIDGELQFGWTSYEAGLLSLADAAGYFFQLLDESMPAVSERQLVGVA